MNVDLKTFKNQANPVAKFYNEAGTLVDTETGTESATVKGTYRFTPTLADGYYDYTIELPGDGSSAGAVHVVGQVVVNDGDAISQLKSEQAVKDAIESLSTTGAITVVSPVDVTGTTIAPIVIGDDYLEVNSTPSAKRHFEWTVPAVPGMNPLTSVMRFGLANDENSCVTTGTITVSGSSWILKADLVRSKTEGFTPADDFNWSVEIAGADGTEVTRVRSGKAVKMVAKQT